MDKATEIKTFQSLKGDTYFNQYFTNEDIDAMCENMKMDFGIEYGIEKLQAAPKLADKQKELDITSKQLEDSIEEADRKTKEVDDLVRFLADQAHKWSATDLRDKAIEMMGENEYIKYCLRKGYTLWEADKDMLIKML